MCHKSMAHPHIYFSLRLNIFSSKHANPAVRRGVSTVQRVKRLKYTIIAIKLLILRSFQRKGVVQ